MEYCHACGKVIKPDEVEWVTVIESKQTHWEPAFYHEVPMHESCAREEPEDPRDRREDL
jgi:hypothetical protein